MTSYGYDLGVARQKVTLYIDPVVLKRLRVAAARRGKRDSDLVEEALDEYLGLAARRRLQEAFAPLVDGMTEDEVLQFAVELQHESRLETS